MTESLWQRYKNVDPKRRIFLALGVFFFSATALYIDALPEDKKPFSKKKTEIPTDPSNAQDDKTYKFIDYSKPKAERVTIIKNGQIINNSNNSNN